MEVRRDKLYVIVAQAKREATFGRAIVLAHFVFLASTREQSMAIDHCTDMLRDVLLAAITVQKEGIGEGEAPEFEAVARAG